MTENARNQDFEAALSEIRGNVETRRLMFVFMHVLLPTSIIALADVVTGSSYPPNLVWFPRYAFTLVSGLVAAAGLVVCAVLMRCHFGLVINGTKLTKVQHGQLKSSPLNWNGVTTNFVLLTTLAIMGSLCILTVSFGAGWVVGAATAVAGFALVAVLLDMNHRRATKLAARLSEHWEPAEIPNSAQERHNVLTLEDANADIAIVVTMAAALFAGFFGGMSKIGSLSAELDIGLSPERVQDVAMPALGGYLTLSLLLTARMVRRLRTAIGDHSQRLAHLRNEPDDPWRFRVLERTFLLHSLVVVLLAFSCAMLVWHFTNGTTAGISAAALGAWNVAAYGLTLRSGRRRLGT